MVVGLFLLLALCVRGWSQEGWSGSWTTSNDLVPTLSATEIARPRPAKATVVTAGATQLPDRLPIGSESELLDYIVSTNLWINLYFSLSFTNDSGRQIQFNKTRYGGYQSFKKFMEDLTIASEDSIFVVANSTNYNGSTINATVLLHYLEAGNPHPVGLWLTRYNLGVASQLTPNIITNTLFGLSSQYDTVQAVVPVPILSGLDIEVTLDSGQLASYSWSSSGITKANWQGKLINDTISGYVLLNKWFSTGVYRARITIESGNHSTIYTQFGEQISPPTLKMNEYSLEISAPHGADVTVFRSTDLNNWIQDTVLESVEPIFTIPIYRKEGTAAFFRATVR